MTVMSEHGVTTKRTFYETSLFGGKTEKCVQPTSQQNSSVHRKTVCTTTLDDKVEAGSDFVNFDGYLQ